MSHVSRRLFAASALAAPFIANSAFAQGKVTLTYSDTIPEIDPRATILKDIFGKSLGDGFEFKPYFASTLYKQGTEAVAMQRGNLDMSNLASFDIAKQIPMWNIVSTPYMFRDRAHMKAVFASDVGKELFDALEKEMNIKALAVPYIGTRHLNLKPKKKIMKPEDLAGIRLRMPPGEGWQFVGQAMGASTVPVAFPELYTALQSGTVDGQDNPLPANKINKFYEVTTQIILTGHLIANNIFAISKAKWDSLDKAQQALVTAAAQKFEVALDAQIVKDEAEVMDFLKANGNEIYTPDLKAFRDRVLDQYAKSKFAADWKPGHLERINKL
jgi:TRAP-type transport system periplasmic protein